MAESSAGINCSPRKVTLRAVGVCRVCKEKKTKNHTFDIFGSLAIRGRDRRSYQSKVEKLFEIQINKVEGNDNASRICNSCANFIDKVWKFREEVREKERNSEYVSTKRGATDSPRQLQSEVSGVAVMSRKSLNFDPVVTSNEPDPSLQNDFISLSSLQTKWELLNKRKEPNKSVLYDHSYEGLAQFSLDELWDELKLGNPDLLRVFETVTKKTGDDLEVRTKFSFIYALLRNLRWHELSNMKRVMTVLVIEGGCSKELHSRLNKLGIVLASSKRDILLKLIGGHFLDRVIENVKKGFRYNGTGDNWDMVIKAAHMRKGIGNIDLHLFATNLFRDRIDFSSLSIEKPLRDINTLPESIFHPSLEELIAYKDSAKVIIGRIAVEFLPALKSLKSVLPDHIPHEFSTEMNQKSEIVSMPIIDADEKKYGEVVKILRIYEKWWAEIHRRAGIIDDTPVTNDMELPGEHSRPGQPGAHFVDFRSKYIAHKIMMFGDQLTRKMFAGAKDLLSGAHSEADRFEHISPFGIAMWHCKASFLQFIYHRLCDTNSVDEVGTLWSFREAYNRRNVTPKKVLDSYEGCEELVISMGKAYIVTALMEFLGMEGVDDCPTTYEIDDAQKFFDEVISKFVEKYVMQWRAPANWEDDGKMSYGLFTIYVTVLLLQMKDTAKEGDGTRNLINQKLLLSTFKSLSSCSRYALEMFTCIAQVECLLPPQLAARMKWGYFVNWKGGKGKNVETDLAQEVSNRLSKKIVQRMGANKTIPSITKVTRAANGVKEIVENFDTAIGHKKGSSHHTTRPAAEDEREMINDLLRIRPFTFKPGRSHRCFEGIKRCPSRYMKATEFYGWIKKHINELTVFTSETESL